jgi:hypothetical protein
MDHKLTTLEKAGTWITVTHPPGKNIVGSKWVFYIKRTTDGSIAKYKACLVARGFVMALRGHMHEVCSLISSLDA